MNIDKNKEFCKKWGNKKSISFNELLDSLFRNKSYSLAMKELGRSDGSFITAINRHFPGVKLTGGGDSWLLWFINKSDFKKCHKCKEFKLKTEFSNNKSKWDGLQTECKSCDYENTKKNNRANVAKYKAKKLLATPAWADLDKIREFYANCPEGYHVDHIIPLQGEYISGLHVENNLQYLLARDNLSKGNKFQN